MRHLKKKNKWECLLYSFAMALGVEPGVLVAKIGHDGGEQTLFGFHRGFHIQELTRVARGLGIICDPIECSPVSLYPSKDVLGAVDQTAWWRYVQGELNNSQGVITGQNMDGSGGHAVAFSHGIVLNPDGGVPYPATLDDFVANHFVPQTVWIVRQCFTQRNRF